MSVSKVSCDGISKPEAEVLKPEMAETLEESKTQRPVTPDGKVVKQVLHKSIMLKADSLTANLIKPLRS